MLAMKYHVQYIADEAIGRLRMCFPSKLKYIMDSPFGRANNEDIKDPVLLEPEDSIGVINLARTYHLPYLIPAAFYSCCQEDASTMLCGVVYGAEHVYLSQDDLRLYMSTTGRPH